MATIDKARKDRAPTGAEARRPSVLPDGCGHVDCAPAAGVGQRIGTVSPGAKANVALLNCEFNGITLIGVTRTNLVKAALGEGALRVKDAHRRPSGPSSP